MQIPIIYHKNFSKYDFGRTHPFNASRFMEFMKIFHELRLDKIGTFKIIEPKIASDKDLELVHTKKYIEHAKKMEQIKGHLSIDTYVLPGMIDANKLIVGAVLEAGNLLLQDKCKIAVTFGGFHHAGVESGEGFCIFNDIAITTKKLIEKGKKVMIIDTDAHQGNGTMDIFYEDANPLFMSIHQNPRTLYPGRGFIHEKGKNEGEGFTINIPMPMFAGNKEFEYALNEVFVPVAKEFIPDIIIRNGGCDPHFSDELTALGLDLIGLNKIGKIVRGASDSINSGLIDLTVSGYSKLVPYGWLALISGVTSVDVDFSKIVNEPKKIVPDWAKEEYLFNNTINEVNEIKKEFKDYWSCFQ